MFLAVTLFSGCVQQQQQPEDQLPPVKTIEDIAIELVTLLMQNNFTGVYGFFNTSITSQITADDFANIWMQQIVAPNGDITRIVQNTVDE